MRQNSPLFKGIRAGMPIALGYFPIAIAFGALAVQAHMSWWEAVLMSVIVFAGASQFVGVSMMLAGAGAIQIITTTFFLNMRHLIMSLAVNDQMRLFSGPWKNLLSFFITDETFALLTLGEGMSSTEERSPVYMAGLMITAYVGWVSGTAVGGVGAGFIPQEITTAMTVGLYGLFIGLLVPPARKSLCFSLIALTSMVLNWVLGQFLDAGWAIVMATILAAGLGIILIKEEN
ncbi:MAG: AzlC family ABC transporter permease [Anaerolineales bacterium]|nr:AzlC family ABC transporter permease [Anaerolineales bacterium]